MTRREDLSTPRQPRRLGVHYDPEAFGRFSESIARTLGTARFLVIQTVIVVVWIFINITFVVFRWDPYPFILLNLAFSTQAAYAAPLILLAQNRQDDRDRVQYEGDRARDERSVSDTEYLRFDNYPFIFLTLMLSLQASYAAPLILLAQNRQEVRDRVVGEQDRQANARAHADMEFLAREVASLRMALGEVATRDYLRSELRGLLNELDERSGADEPDHTGLPPDAHG